MKTIWVAVVAVLLCSLPALAEQAKGPEMVSWGVTTTSIRDLYPKLTILNNLPSAAFSGASWANLNGRSPAKWAVDEVTDMQQDAIKVALEFCTGKFNDEQRVIYGVTDFDFEISRTDNDFFLSAKYDLYCGK